jgi:hypothetical protein
MVIVAVPVVAVPLAVSVRVLLLVGLMVLAGLNDAVTPEGVPVADNATLPLKPFCGATVMVLVPVAPCTTLKLLGEVERVKLGDAAVFTVRERVVVAVKLPEVPVIVIVVVPVVAVLLAVSVSVLVPEVLAGLNDAVTPEGTPEADSATLPPKPFCGLTVRVLVPPEPPWVMVALAGEADKVKPGTGAGFTVRDTVVVLVKLPEMPVIVIVAFPVVAVLLAVSVSMLVPEVLTGLNDAVTPEGTPEADSATLPLNPFCGATVTVLVALEPPCVMDKLAGDADSVKVGVGDGGTLTETLSKMAVVGEEVLPLVTAKPTYTVWPIVMDRLLPTGTQFTPSFDA